MQYQQYILCGPSAVWLHTATSKNNTEDYDTTENEKEDGDDDEVLRPNTPSESQHRAQKQRPHSTTLCTTTYCYVCSIAMLCSIGQCTSGVVQYLHQVCSTIVYKGQKIEALLQSFIRQQPIAALFSSCHVVCHLYCYGMEYLCM